MTGGGVPTLTAYEFEDHTQHIRIINQLRKTIWYQELPKHRQRGIDIHEEQHQMFLRKQTEPAQQPAQLPGRKGKKAALPMLPAPVEPIPEGEELEPLPSRAFSPTSQQFGGSPNSMDGLPPGLAKALPPGLLGGAPAKGRR